MDQKLVRLIASLLALALIIGCSALTATVWNNVGRDGCSDDPTVICRGGKGGMVWRVWRY